MRYRWQIDPLCNGDYPRTFDEMRRTMEDWRKAKYGKAPKNAKEIEDAFKKSDIFETLGKSLYRGRGTFYNCSQITENYENCIFSSPRSIQLIKENVDEKDRFFLMDATFSITPRGSFQQVLIIYAQFGPKVRLFYASLCRFFSNDFLIFFSDFSISVRCNDKAHNASIFGSIIIRSSKSYIVKR